MITFLLVQTDLMIDSTSMYVSNRFWAIFCASSSGMGRHPKRDGDPHEDGASEM